ncbi:hypothetical protein V8E36_007763 [Tilletia maclaganii]
MSLLVAPYNNAMRLGQGFNSYTQQICIDDAVVIDPRRDENVLNNSGLTMKMLAEQTGTLSALERIPGLASVSAPPQEDGSQNEVVFTPEGNTTLGKIDDEATQPKSSTGSAPALKKSTVGSSPPDPKKRDEERKKALQGAADEFKEAMSLQEMQEKLQELQDRFDQRQKDNVQDVREAPGTAMPWTPTEALGPGQIVTYASKFVNKLSEVTDEMGISGSLSIKYNAIGGSGSGSFFDAEKFYDSDLRYLVSVKVINQTVNFKDALVFNPLRSCMRDQQKFNDTFGDSFISGFLEGGEFNALVLKTIHNKDKKRDITAEAKVALTAGPVEVSAQGNVKLAEQNLSNNSETSVYVRWCGGGNIKPYDHEWTIQSVMAAAARFPALVGLFPQRTHAVLTKYETLRSYLLLKPVSLSPLRYELAQMYTNQMLDAYMEYKSIAKRLSDNIADIQAGLKEFARVDLTAQPTLSSSLVNAGLSFYPATLIGLDDARKAIRNQMNIIVDEVDSLTDEPQLGSDPNHKQPFVGPGSFAVLLPEVEVRSARKRITASPLDVERINKVSDASKAVEDTTNEEAPPLFNTNGTALRLSSAEQTKLAELEWQSYGIGTAYQVSAPVGDQDRGKQFCTLDFAQSEESIAEITLIVDSEGKLRSIVLGFNNGLICTFGATVHQKDLDAAPPGHKLKNISSAGESIITGKIQYYEYTDAQNQLKQRVVGISLPINQERKVESLLKEPCPAEQGKLKTESFGVPASGLKLSGLWGQMIEEGNEASITRLGFVWGPAISSAAKAADEPGRPKTITSVARSIYPKTTADNVLNTVKFPYMLLAEPRRRLLYAPHFLKSAAKTKEAKDTEKMERLLLLAGVNQEKITTKAFELEARTRFGEDAIYCNYLVLPEFSSATIECGELDFGNLQGQTSAERGQDFFKAYPDKAVPVARCWITAINAKPKEEGGLIHVKVSPSTCTEKGIKVSVEALEGTKIESIKVGWIAHTAPEKTNANFVSGNVRTENIVDTSKYEAELADKLQEKASSEFVGINEIKTVTTNLVGFGAIFMPETTRDKICMGLSSFGKNPIQALGLSLILSM